MDTEREIGWARQRKERSHQCNKDQMVVNTEKHHSPSKHFTYTHIHKTPQPCRTMCAYRFN